MRVLLQRVLNASVTVDGQEISNIQHGFVLLVAIAPQDTEKELNWMAKKIAGLRVFADADGKMNLSLDQVEGSVLAVSQFTLYADCNKGKRPFFQGVASPEEAQKSFDLFMRLLENAGVKDVQQGQFAADMKVRLVNDGPVTIMLERENK